MKPIIKFAAVAIVCIVSICFYSCRNEIKKYPYPDWKVNPANDFSVSMTAVVKLPKSFSANFNASDPLAAFIGEECRGVGQLVNDSLYFVSIQGTPSENSKVYFMFYSTFSRNMFKTDFDLTFRPNETYGTATNPEVLKLVLMMK